jgi:hypothetical protein
VRNDPTGLVRPSPCRTGPLSAKPQAAPRNIAAGARTVPLPAVERGRCRGVHAALPQSRVSTAPRACGLPMSGSLLRCPRLPQAASGAEALERVLPGPCGGARSGVVAFQLVSLGDSGGGTHGLTGTGPGWHPPGQPRSAGRSRDVGVPQPARSPAVDPGPGGRLAVTELLARVGGSSVKLELPLRRSRRPPCQHGCGC